MAQNNHLIIYFLSIVKEYSTQQCIIQKLFRNYILNNENQLDFSTQMRLSLTALIHYYLQLYHAIKIEILTNNH